MFQQLVDAYLIASLKAGKAAHTVGGRPFTSSLKLNLEDVLALGTSPEACDLRLTCQLMRCE